MLTSRTVFSYSAFRQRRGKQGDTQGATQAVRPIKDASEFPRLTGLPSIFGKRCYVPAGGFQLCASRQRKAEATNVYFPLLMSRRDPRMP